MGIGIHLCIHVKTNSSNCMWTAKRLTVQIGECQELIEEERSAGIQGSFGMYSSAVICGVRCRSEVEMSEDGRWNGEVVLRRELASRVFTRSSEPRQAHLRHFARHFAAKQECC